MDHLKNTCRKIAEKSQAAAASLRSCPGAIRNQALRHIAQLLLENKQALADANAKDLDHAKQAQLSPAMIDRLALTDARIHAMASALIQIADQEDPVGRVLQGSTLSNGIQLKKVSTPIGSILIIFESRPNVTIDAAALCLKAGNATILRGGKEALHSNTALAKIISRGLAQANIDPHAVQLIQTTDRQAVTHLLQMQNLIDLCIPRGGPSLIRAVVEQAKIPVIKHYTGNCHLYIDQNADPQMAIAIAVNSKTQRTGVCNATETILLHHDLIRSGLAHPILQALKNQHVQLRLDPPLLAIFPDATPAQEADYQTEFLDLILAVKTVKNLDQAIDHINRYSSQHTEAIVTNHLQNADRFTQAIDSANVFVNCSTRFSDGGEYGLGAEIGISTDKLHARGPMGAKDLTTYKWIAQGNGQIRK